MLDACVASVRAAGGADQIIVVDNGGGAAVDADVQLIRPGRNLGFGGGANAGFRRAAELGATEVVLLDDDLVVDAGWLQPLQAALHADDTLGAVQPKLLMAGSVPARVNSVGVGIDAAGAGSDIGFGELDGPAFADERSIESFTGGAVLFRSRFLDETHGFDESYFLYYEDADLAKRGSELGWTYRCVPASIVRHRVSASTAQLGDRGQIPAGAQPVAVRLPLRRRRHDPPRPVVVDAPRSVAPAMGACPGARNGCCIRACGFAGAPRRSSPLNLSRARVAFIRTLSVANASRVLQLFDAPSPPDPRSLK